jgi:hypothetical protein
MFAYTARKVFTSMAVAVPDESSAVAVAVALAVVSETLRNPPASLTPEPPPTQRA